jgi:hypothetical protein
MANIALSPLTNKLQKSGPPTRKSAPQAAPSETNLEDAYKKSETSSGSWKKLALLGAAGLGLAAGAQVMWNPGPSEPAQVMETTPNCEVTDLQQDKGLNAVPQDWIPQGESKVYAEGPLGVARGTTTRSPQRIFLDLDGRINPDLTLTNLGEGKVEAYVDLPGPFDQKSVGTLTRQGDQLLYQADNGTTSATFEKNEEGTIEATLKRKGWDDWNLTYQGS